MKKAKIPLSRKGGKVKIIVLIILIGMTGIKVDSKSYTNITNDINYMDKLVSLDSYKTQEVQKTTTTKKTTTSKTTTKKITTSTKKTKSSNKTTTKNSKGTQIATYAKKFVGNPYVHGGTSLTKGTDCSGFTQSIYKKYGKSLPRTVESQAKVGTKVSFSKLQAGDLVFYSNGSSKPTHVAIYIGNGKIIHASNPRDGIKISSVNIMTKVTARRIKL